MKTSVRLAGAGLALLTMVGTVACSDDDDKAGSSTESTSPSGDGGSGPVINADFCASSLDYYAALNEIPEESPEMAKAYIGTGLLSAAEELAASLPPSATAYGTTIVDAVKASAGTGDTEALFAPDVAEAQTQIGETLFGSCDMNQIDATAVEYEFEGVPAEVPAGPTVVKLSNEGVEAHEMVLFKRNDGSTETLDEIMELPEDEMMSKLAFTGAAFGEPGTNSYTAIDLQPGTYFLICFIPVGGGEDGPPHFMQGMQQTITVA